MTDKEFELQKSPVLSQENEHVIANQSASPNDGTCDDFPSTLDSTPANNNPIRDLVPKPMVICYVIC